MITVEEVKAARRIEHSEEDALLESLIKSALQYIERRTGQIFVKREQEEMVLDQLPAGSNGIELHWTPVRAVQSVSYLGAGGVAESLGEGEVYLDGRGVYPVLYPVNGAQWPESTYARGSVTVVADIGYAELPYDIRLAALLLIGHFYENREAVVIGTIAASVPHGFEMLIADYIIERVA